MISVIFPIYNEEDCLDNLFEQLMLFIKKNPSLNLEIIFVNDGSHDSTFSILKERKKNLNCKVISLSKNFGSHAALRAGILHSSNNLITFMYADLQDPLDLIIDLYNEYKLGADVVWANRKSDEIEILEGLFSRAYSYLMRKYAVDNFPKKGFDIVFFNKKVKDVLNDNIVANSFLRF